MPLRLDINDADFEAEFSRFLDARRDSGGDVAEVVAAIIGDVRQRGDRALIDYSRRFDRCELTAETIRVGSKEIEQAAADCEPAVIKALNAARARIADYHARQMPAISTIRTTPGSAWDIAGGRSPPPGFMCRGPGGVTRHRY